LLELHGRLSATGRCDDDRMEIPVGQRILAQALALSAVQVNKVFSHLRAASVLSSARGSIRIEDMAALQYLAGHDARSGTARSQSANPHAAAPSVGATASG